jgi:hypothetical protein
MDEGVVITIVTDSSACLPRSPPAPVRSCVRVLPVVIHLQDRDVSGDDPSAARLVYEALARRDAVKSSAPTVVEYLQALPPTGDDGAVVIAPAAEFTAMVTNASLAADLAEADVRVVDSRTAAAAQGLVVLAAAEAAAEGASLDEVEAAAYDGAGRARLVATLERVDALRRSGRVSPLVLPVEEICRRCRERGVLTVVDGAHAPGQLPLRVVEVGADVYTGNCHKWLCSPRGAAFLHVRPEHQGWIGSAIVSWGWEDGHTFQSRNAWQGTDDPSAYLAVPDAVDFHRRHLGGAGAARARALLLETRRRVAELTGLEPISGEEAVAQMAALPVPEGDVEALGRRLLAEHAVEVQPIRWGDRAFVRVSCTAYTQTWETDRLVDALPHALAATR